MKIEPGMLCELVLPPGAHPPQHQEKYLGALVIVDGLGSFDDYFGEQRWLVTVELDGTSLDPIESSLRPLPPPPLPGKVVEKELEVS